MATRYAADEAEIRQLIDSLVEAIRTADLDALRTVFTPDIVSFDVAPPLRYVGAEAKLNNWAVAFKMVQPPLGYEIRDLTITVGDEVAFAYGLNRLSGTLPNGDRFGPWVRWTGCFRKIDGTWRIAHDQVSVPADFTSGRAVLDLQP